MADEIPVPRRRPQKDRDGLNELFKNLPTPEELATLRKIGEWQGIMREAGQSGWESVMPIYKDNLKAFRKMVNDPETLRNNALIDRFGTDEKAKEVLGNTLKKFESAMALGEAFSKAKKEALNANDIKSFKGAFNQMYSTRDAFTEAIGEVNSDLDTLPSSLHKLLPHSPGDINDRGITRDYGHQKTIEKELKTLLDKEIIEEHIRTAPAQKADIGEPDHGLPDSARNVADKGKGSPQIG